MESNSNQKHFNYHYNTSYTIDYPPKEAMRKQPIKKIGAIDNIVLGSDQGSQLYLSEAKLQYGDKKRLPDQPKMNKPKNNIDLGDINTQYVSHYQDIHNDQFNQHTDNKLSQQEIMKLKQKNYTTGFQNLDYKLSSEVYGSKLCPPNKLTRDTIDKMRNTNIVIGHQNAFKGNTSYNTSFAWKQKQ